MELNVYESISLPSFIKYSYWNIGSSQWNLNLGIKPYNIITKFFKKPQIPKTIQYKIIFFSFYQK